MTSIGGCAPVVRSSNVLGVRTDDDSWDITTGVGSTALFVAAARALEAQRPEPLAVDEYAEMFCRAVGSPWAELLDGTVGEHPLRTGDFGTHFVTYQGARTRFFDDYFRRAAAAGVRQVVLLAAGLDSRAYRLDWPAGTTVFELDRPQVLDFKRRTLDGNAASAKARRREVALDLREEWPSALRDNGFRADEPSAWIAEGLLIYLPARAQQQLFDGIDALACPGSRLALEEGRPMDPQAFRAKLAEAAAEGASTDARAQWWQLVYNEQIAPAADWFGDRGWTATATALADYLRAVGRRPPEGDAEVVTMVDSITLVEAVKGESA